MDKIEPRQEQEVAEVADAPAINHNEANIRSLQGYFGVEAPSTDQDKKLADIYRMATGDEMYDMEQILLFLRGIEQKLGATPIGETRLNRVYNYLRLMDSMRVLEAKKQMYER